MENENIKPSIIKIFYDMNQKLLKVGFSQRDIILMLRDRTKPRLGMREVENMLQAIIQFEKDFTKFYDIIGEKNREALE